MGSLVLLVIVAAFWLWIYWPLLAGWCEISMGIGAIRSCDLSGGVIREGRFSANTFENECSSETIRGFYNQAAQTLARRSSEVRTYYWLDRFGYDRVSTVLQMKGGHIEVCASCNNDNDAIDVQFAFGDFEKPDSRLLPSVDLPEGMLRCSGGP